MADNFAPSLVDEVQDIVLGVAVEKRRLFIIGSMLGGPQIFLMDLGRYQGLINGPYVDLIVVAGDEHSGVQSFGAHRIILCTQSKRIECDCKHASSGDAGTISLHYPNIAPNTMLELLKIAYAGHIDVEPTDRFKELLKELYTAAHYLEMSHVKVTIIQLVQATMRPNSSYGLTWSDEQFISMFYRLFANVKKDMYIYYEEFAQVYMQHYMNMSARGNQPVGKPAHDLEEEARHAHDYASEVYHRNQYLMGPPQAPDIIQRPDRAGIFHHSFPLRDNAAQHPDREGAFHHHTFPQRGNHLLIAPTRRNAFYGPSISETNRPASFGQVQGTIFNPTNLGQAHHNTASNPSSAMQLDYHLPLSTDRQRFDHWKLLHLPLVNGCTAPKTPADCALRPIAHGGQHAPDGSHRARANTIEVAQHAPVGIPQLTGATQTATTNPRSPLSITLGAATAAQRKFANLPFCRAHPWPQTAQARGPPPLIPINPAKPTTHEQTSEHFTCPTPGFTACSPHFGGAPLHPLPGLQSAATALPNFPRFMPTGQKFNTI